ncbi:MAG: Fe(3+) ABC transporter substrate-binding protein [Haliea sp.]|uniref:Fe(3+) ABC transporter substrate-binding protein n=1 Tax=Haliea sp. TaxID=1932666 RepID=UPI0032F034A0
MLFARRGRPTASSLLALVMLPLLVACSSPESVNVYSARQEALIKPLLDRFSAETGIAVNLVTGDGDALLARLRNEGLNSPADLLLTSDAGNLYRAQQADLLQAVSSPALEAAVPVNLRSDEGYWYGLSLRARVLVYAPDRVDAAELSDYAALADPSWRQRICVRSSGNIYNQSMVAGMLASQGAEATQAWLQGFVANFARQPQGGDRDQIKAVASGQCDVALVNSYYLGGMLNSEDAEERAAAERVRLFWPNQAGRGVHVNISGAGITRSATHSEEARQLIEFMLREDSQQWYAEANNEYPVRPDVAPSDLLQSWGEFKADPLNMSELGRLNAQAVMAMDQANWK